MQHFNKCYKTFTFKIIISSPDFIMKTLLIVLLAAFCVSAIPKDGDRKHIGSQMFRAFPKTESQVRYLIGLYNSGKYDFWTTPRAVGSPVEILASRWMVHGLREAFKVSKIQYEVAIPDMYKAIKINRIENEIAYGKSLENARTGAGAGAMDWTSYHTYDEINEWVDSLATTYPDLVTVEDVGQSLEGRTMKIVKVSTGGTGKPAIFSDAGIHAREWIAPATLTYIMNELLSNSAAYQDVLDTVDFYFMPDINPDGYEYSRTDDRLWRKTRSPTDSGLGCIGVDANRNWDFHWMESGSSSNACTETYAGPTPFSEIEAVNVRDQMLKYADNTKVYLTFHSYGQVMIYPWGYDESLPDDWEDLDSLARSATDALTAVHGTKYQVGSSGTLLYPASGASDDYSKGVALIKYAYTVELRPTANNPGFELPPNQIIPTGEETFALFETIMDFVRDTYGQK